MNTAKPEHPDRAYHHGDLQRAIVNAAIDVLRETQSTEFSLRELARRAGVSHNAPYKHFADKRELLGAVSAAGFDQLADRMSDAGRGRSNPRTRLTAMARSHVRQGIENPALYRLMFGGLLGVAGDGRPTIEMAAAEKLRALIEGAVIDGALGSPVPRSRRNTSKIDSAVLSYWSQIHGLTLLLIDRLVGPSARSDNLAVRAVNTMIDGLAAGIPALPSDVWVGPRILQRTSEERGLGVSISQGGEQSLPGQDLATGPVNTGQ
ncbi:MAG: TetR family transcriptional regulator [Mesorhizobium sp.]|uniref:TetR/AcrR family transcriptional regulator n=1 Tax=Mesorhizobium sp. M1E.F.Ca.ET.045.02.1.1 TaxID=2493672 RepID=UPI000F74E079|nr:TetR/AcrR family transcriptional regulator [Mesorhizobium sp. M1E.F.Ca.ET.045.02.1.1]AZO19829.1 TetR/AcrR family transcriptional regulator [Mesorhizobium sp. M1E.F.Ca.ET.045.02.1.1]TIU35338.1 MAG: TetR family transcriptional regulator [Mesorhizobium sp.]TKB14966.1 MAG: TetR family transcriptional regulator [Mesorhizobium sp.]